MNKYKKQHISQQFDIELRGLREKTMHMAHLVEQQLTDALDALLNCNVELSRQVIQRDYKVNAYEVDIDEECVTILVRRQPIASDLRNLIAVVKTITDLERIGDEAKNIAHIVTDLEHTAYINYLVEIEHLGKQVLSVLHQAIEAFGKIESETETAKKLLNEDTVIDRHYGNINRQLITYMMEDARTIPSVLELMWIARALERIADRACNICNYVLYCAEGLLTHSK